MKRENKFINAIFGEYYRNIYKIIPFNDEPQVFEYAAEMPSVRAYSDGSWPNKKIFTTGISFTSKEKAFLKCLVELCERINLFCYRKKQVIFSDNQKIPEEFTNNTTSKFQKIGWIKSFDLLQEKEVLIPAQMVYLNFLNDYKENSLSTIVSTGAAGGFDHESTLLRGIYEIIERDCFMTAYLNKIRIPKIDISHIKDDKIKHILDSLIRYRLDWLLFDLTNDLQIPGFISIIIDKTGKGPAISVGLKSGLNIKKAITGSIEEALIGRFTVRNEFIKRKQKRLLTDPENITNYTNRGLYWFPLEMVSKLDFWLNQYSVKYELENFNVQPREELNIIKNILKKKGHQAYYANITLEMYKKMNLFVYKVIIPSLQPLYLSEKNRMINFNRLKTVSEYFGQKHKLPTNIIPHPIL